MNPTMNREPLVEAKPHLSYTQLNMLLRCGEQYRRRYIEGEKVPPGSAGALGKSFHLAQESNYRQKITSKQDLPAQAVKDNGVGIAQEDIPKLFQRFSQVGEGRVRKGGTGLGLALCKELAQLHGGKIRVASEPHKGSTFSFTLPIYTSELALEESLKGLAEVAKKNQKDAVALIAMDVKPLLEEPSLFARQDHANRLEQVVELVRHHIHGDDVVLGIEPTRVVILAIADENGARSIVERIRQDLQGDSGPAIDTSEDIPVLVGVSRYPRDGLDAGGLLAKATSTWHPEVFELRMTTR